MYGPTAWLRLPAEGIELSRNKPSPGRELPLPPGLCVDEVVEGEDVEAGNLRVRACERGGEAFDQLVRVEATGLDEPRDEVAVTAEKPKRLPDPDPRRHPEQLRPGKDAGNPEENRKPRAAGPDVVDPLNGDTGVEADLARDVRRVPCLPEHRRDRRLVVD